jgi:hypothetical protein
LDPDPEFRKLLLYPTELPSRPAESDLLVIESPPVGPSVKQEGFDDEHITIGDAGFDPENGIFRT